MITVVMLLLIIGALLIAAVVEENISVGVGDGSFAPVFLLSFFLAVLVCALACNAGRDAATHDYTAGKITIEKIPVVTKEIR